MHLAHEADRCSEQLRDRGHIASPRRLERVDVECSVGADRDPDGDGQSQLTLGAIGAQIDGVSAAGAGDGRAQIDGDGQCHTAGMVGVIADEVHPTGGVGPHRGR